MKLTKKSKELKQRILKFVTTDEIARWTILISRKGLSTVYDDRAIWGEIDLAAKEITIDPYRGNFVGMIKTAIHEVLHGVRPKASEKEVRRWEKQIYYDMTPVERTSFINGFFGHAMWNE